MSTIRPEASILYYFLHVTSFFTPLVSFLSNISFWELVIRALYYQRPVSRPLTQLAAMDSYFDFDQAAVPPLDLSVESSSLFAETNELEGNECYDSLFLDRSAGLPADTPIHQSDTVKLKLINDTEVEAVRSHDDPDAQYPMFKAKTPCTLCAQMGMDCYLASRGMLITGCTACISLYRECSFTSPEMPKGYRATFQGIAEDEQVCHGAVTGRSKVLNSAMADTRGRKSGARFHRDAIKILKQWLSEHADHPYPNEREKDELKQLTGLKRSQISNWLANARRRGKVRTLSAPASPILGAVDIPTQNILNKGYENLGPLDRWKCSPPENEPALMTDIAKAVTNKDFILPTSQNQSISSIHNSRPSSRKASSEDDSNLSIMFQPPSISSFETRESSNSTFSLASSRSHRSRQSYASSQERRRRRRLPLAHQRNSSIVSAAAASANTATKGRKNQANRIFQCTFCTDTFPSKYDWQRHEKSLHIALERWTCCPMGQTRIDPQTGLSQCVFCTEFSPSADHVESHNFQACHEKTVAERTFYRKDHLRQHLRLMHGVKFDPHMDTWKSTTFEIQSRCGFCPSLFATWQARADHLAAHFRNGADMKDWTGGWGFEPFIEKIVENAIPPYLIGYERGTMNPYRARELKKNSSSNSTHTTPPTADSQSQTDHSCDRVEVDQMTKDSNCWHRLEEELIKYIHDQRIQGHTITDDDIRNQARIVVYGDPDPWDWTQADNQIWLDAFKHEQGLTPSLTETVTTSPSDYTSTRFVPVMAPYVVKGGLKTKKVPTSAHGGQCDKPQSVGHRASIPTTSLPGIQERGCPRQAGYASSSRQSSSYTGGTPGTPVTEDFFGLGLPTDGHVVGKQAVTHPASMELDFDAIDFNTLDLNAFGEIEFNHGEVGGQAYPVTTTADSMGTGAQPIDFANLGLDLDYDMDMEMDLDIGTGTCMHEQKPLPQPLASQVQSGSVLQNAQKLGNVFDDLPEMSLEAFDQLTGYMSGFR